MPPDSPASARTGDPLESWKEIAAYLGRDVRTVQRWERTEGLPVHRHMHARQGSVYALRRELDAWKRRRLQGVLCSSASFDQPATSGSSPVASSEAANRPSERSGFVLKHKLAAVLGVSIVLSAGALLMKPKKALVDQAVLPIRFTTFPGSEISPVFSPDGGRVAFAWNGNPTHRFQICIQTVDSHRLSQLTKGPRDSYSPAWSPSGDRIAFLRSGLGQTTSVVVLPASGGAEREITTLNLAGTPWNRDLTWSPDGQWLASTANLSDKGSGVMLISFDTGKQRLLTHPPGGAMDMMPVFSSNGRAIAFVRDNYRDRGQLEWLRLRSDLTPDGEAEQLDYPLCRGEAQLCVDPWWTPRGQEIVFTARSGGIGRIWRAAVPHGRPQLLESIGEGASHPAISPAGDRLVYEQVMRDQNIYVADLARAGESAPAIVSTLRDQNPSVSPDGKRVAFESNRSGRDEIWVSDPDGSNAQALTSFNGPITGSPNWSPDGSSIAFDSVNSGPQIYLMEANGAHRRQMTSDSGFNAMPAWSPDGKWVYFTSRRSGDHQIWRMPATGGAETQLTHEGGAAPLPSSDGRWIYYMKATSPMTSLWRVSAEGGPEFEVVRTVFYRAAALAVSGIYYFTRSDEIRPPSLEYLDLPSGRVRRVFTVSKPVGSGMSLSPDQHHLFYTLIDTEESDLRLLGSFR
jgi:Tol biopolymer transport system component